VQNYTKALMDVLPTVAKKKMEILPKYFWEETGRKKG